MHISIFVYFKVEHDTLREQNKRLQEECETLRTRLIEVEQQQVLSRFWIMSCVEMKKDCYNYDWQKFS